MAFRVNGIGQGRLGAHPPLELGILHDVGGDEARRADQDQVLGEPLVVHELWPRHAHHFDPDGALAEILDVRRRVRARPGKPHPRWIGRRPGEQAAPQVIRKIRQYREFAAQHAEGLGIPETLSASREPVLPGELGELVDDFAGELLLPGEHPFLGHAEMLVRSPHVLQRLRGREQRRPEPSVEPGPV